MRKGLNTKFLEYSMVTLMSAPSKTDLMYEITYNSKFVPRRARKVNIKTVTIDREEKYFMKNHETGGLYDLSEFGKDVWSLIDGKRTAKEIYEDLEGTYKDLRPDLVKESLLYYAQEGLLESSLEPLPKKRVNVISAFWVRVSLIWESTPFIQSIHRVVQPLFKKWLLWPILLFVTVMGLLFAGNFVSIFVHKENFEIFGSSVVGFFFYFFIVLGPIIAVHEIAHGLVLVHYGGEPTEMGTGLYFFGPMFYIDVTDGWALNRYQRIMVYAAGPFSEIFIASTIMVIQFLYPFPTAVSHILTMAVFYCFYGLLIDLSPLLETDGYNILCDVVKIPDLRSKSFNYIKAHVKGIFKKTDDPKREPLTKKAKTIILVYAALAVVWAVYLVFRSLLMVSYMAQDTATSVLNVSSAILLSNPITASAIVLSVASVLYFGMIMSGYGLMVWTSLKKAAKTTLRFEEVHDRDFSVFLYLPKNAPSSLFTSLRQEMAKAAKGFTHNFSVSQNGPMCVAILRMSGAKLAFVQIKQHFQNIERKFDKIYAGFLRNHKSEVLESVAVPSPKGTSLTLLLSEMATQAAKAGSPEAEDVASQVFDRENKTALYLLHSVCGRAWTVELPPNLLSEVGGTLLPTFLVEDLSITDLYDDVEDFKKRTVYGFDSLAKLASENQIALQEALLHPERYQVISTFEPVKSRLVFVGRTEQIENVLDVFGSLFVCQVWCGYLDNLFSEVNLGLFALSRTSLPFPGSVRSMKDGELEALERDLSVLIDHERLAIESLRALRDNCKSANQELEGLEKRFDTMGEYKAGLLSTTFQINAENLEHLPAQFNNFKLLSQELFTKIKRAEKVVKRELDKRKPLVDKKRRRMLSLYPFVLALSAVLAAVGVAMFTGYSLVASVAGALLLQFSYLAVYLWYSRSLNSVGRYPSLAFRQVHSFAFAFTESLYKFMTTAKVLTPIELPPEKSRME